jgi:hypothetical protein
MGGTFIPFKRFGGYSYKAGWFILLDPMINFDYRLNDRLYSFVGIGGTLNDISYYVLNDKYNKYTYGLRSQIGLGYKLEGGSSRVDLQACKLGTGRRFTTS